MILRKLGQIGIGICFDAFETNKIGGHNNSVRSIKLCYLGLISKGQSLQEILPKCNNNLKAFVFTLAINGVAHFLSNNGPNTD